MDGIRMLVCGGRDYADKDTVFLELDAILADNVIDCVMQGAATGADHLARLWCLSREVDCLNFKADWDRDKKAAGPIRNQRMIDEGKPNLVVAFPGGRGTTDMVSRAKKARIQVIQAGL